MDRPSVAIKGAPGIKGFGERLACVRQMRCLTQLELSIKTKLHVAAVSHFETGQRRPSAANLRTLCMALNVSADYLLDSHVDSAP